MPERSVEARRHSPEQKSILRRLRTVTARIARHKADFDERNALYAEGRRAGLVFHELAEVAGTSEVAVIQAVKKVTTETGESAKPPERIRRKSITK